MIFSEPDFLAFFALCFAVHWLLATNRARKHWLLASSYFFYACWDWRFLSLILLSTAVDFVAGRAIAGSTGPRRRRWLGFSLATNLGILGFFKYFDFFIESGTGLLVAFGFEVEARTLGLILPVGISFFTFQTLSYTIDVYRGQLEPHRDFIDFALFVSFFPQLVAGPIVRAHDFLPQLGRERHLRDVDGRRLLLLFASGFFKKACLADNVARIIDPVFADPVAYGGADLGLASVLYSVQIYCDFSGYTDMAIAIAGLLGFQLRRNFDFPYLSLDIRDFWRRWHISLSSWLRDYLYIPLGGNRRGRGRALVNLMLTMLLGGLWHGANATFVIWGFLHGLALVAHRGWDALRASHPPLARPARALGALGGGLSWLLTIAWVVGCFALFRSPSIGSAAQLFRGLFDHSIAPVLDPDAWVLLMVLAALHLLLYRRGARLLAWAEGLPRGLFFFSYGVAVATLPLFMPLDSRPFIYFQF